LFRGVCAADKDIAPNTRTHDVIVHATLWDAVWQIGFIEKSPATLAGEFLNRYP
jgi:hypothetical protein